MIARHFKLRPRLLVVLGAVLWVLPADSRAQRSFSPQPESATVEQSAAVDNLLKRADEGVARRDWKFAIDSLQRIVEHPQGLLLERSPMLYESARRVGLRGLLALPPEGRNAYRILNDGQAQGMLDRAIQNHDAEGLRSIVDRYLLTSAGDNAASLLASWLLDEGRPAEALALLDQLEEFCPDTDVASAAIASRRVVAYAMLGQRVPVPDTVAASSAAELERLIEALSGDMAEVGTDGPLAGAAFWPGIAGGGARRGIMPPVTPTLVEDLPWRRLLPGAATEDSVSYVEMADRGLTPVAFPVVAGNRVFVKGQGPCMAIDLQSFEPLWLSEQEVQGIAERYRRRQVRAWWQRDDEPQPLTRAERTRYDYVGSSLSVAGNLVLSIERQGTGEYFDEDGIAVRMQPTPTSRKPGGNRLVAYEADTGTVRWHRGRTGVVSDPLGTARFLAPPVDVGGELWAPALLSGELVVVVIDPDSGDLVHRIGLCTPGDRVPEEVALWPAAGGGMVYVPTGQGLLFAIRAADYRPEWAARYERESAGHRHGPDREPAFWLSGPPVVSGSLVLLAPTDSDAIYAYDRFSGELQWTEYRRGHRYIVAADGEAIWLAGRDVTCLSAENGRERWTTTVAEATGRAALSGTRIYVPHVNGLTALDAATGTVAAEMPMPAGHTAPGNLLALPDGLVSVDGYEIRKYPDLDRAYTRAMAAHDMSPGDGDLAVRLAWMELLRGEPRRTLAALDEFAAPAGALVDHPRRPEAVHLRVEALIALAGQPDTPAEEAVRHLQQAADEAQSDQDALEAGLALGLRLREANRPEDAYRCLWELGRGDTGRLTVSSAGGIERNARSVIAEHLAGLAADLSQDGLELLTEQAGLVVTLAAADLRHRDKQAPAKRTLLAIARAGAPGGWDQAALIELARWQVELGNYERAEQDFRAAIRLAGAPKRTAEALLGLAEMYALPDQHLVLEAGQCLDQLERGTSGGTPLHALQASAPWATTKAQRVADVRASIPPGDVSAHRAAVNPKAFRLVEERAWPDGLEADRQRLVNVFGDRPEALANRLVVAVGDDLLRAHNLADGRMEWEAELRLPADFRLNDLVDHDPETSDARRFGVVEGQTLLFDNASGLHAVGIVTGKRLWAVPRPGGERLRSTPLDDGGTVEAGEGRVAWLPQPNKLEVLDVRDGTIVWRREIDLPTVDAVRIRGNYVVVVGDEYSRAEAYHLASGQRASTMRFRQPEPEHRLVSLHPEAGMLIGPDGSAVIAYDIATGQERWRLRVPEGLGSLFELSPERLGVGTMSGDVLLVDALTGTPDGDRISTECRSGVVAGRLESETLVIGGVTGTLAGEHWLLVGIDLATRDVRWLRDDLAWVSRPPWFLGVARDTIPLLVDLRAQSAPLPDRQHTARAGVAFVDAASGREVGPVWIPDSGPSGEYLAVDLAAWPGVLVVGTRNGVFAIRTAPRGGEATP